VMQLELDTEDCVNVMLNVHLQQARLELHALWVK